MSEYSSHTHSGDSSVNDSGVVGDHDQDSLYELPVNNGTDQGGIINCKEKMERKPSKIDIPFVVSIGRIDKFVQYSEKAPTSLIWTENCEFFAKFRSCFRTIQLKDKYRILDFLLPALIQQLATQNYWHIQSNFRIQQRPQLLRLPDLLSGLPVLAEDPGHPLHHHQRHAVRRDRDALHHPQHSLPRHRAPRHERGPAVCAGPRQQGAVIRDWG